MSILFGLFAMAMMAAVIIIPYAIVVTIQLAKLAVLIFLIRAGYFWFKGATARIRPQLTYAGVLVLGLAGVHAWPYAKAELRARAVAALEREPIAAPMPRVIEFYGHDLPRDAALDALQSRAFDAVYFIRGNHRPPPPFPETVGGPHVGRMIDMLAKRQFKERAVVELRMSDDGQCATLLDQWPGAAGPESLQPRRIPPADPQRSNAAIKISMSAAKDRKLARQSFYALRNELDKCMLRQPVAYTGSDLQHTDALVYLQGNSTTQGAKTQQAIELRRRHRGEDKLVDYWEPYSVRTFSLAHFASNAVWHRRIRQDTAPPDFLRRALAVTHR